MCAAGLCGMAALAGAGAHADELLTWPAHGGATELALLRLPAASESPPWIILLFPGDDGALHLNADGATTQRGNFVIRSAHYWTAAGDATVMVDTPSDQADGVDDAFRLSDAASADVGTLVATLRARFPQAKIALLGTSRGTITVGNILKRTPGLADAYVLTSPVTVAHKNRPGLSGMAWPGNRARVLVVSNQADGCLVSPFAAAQQMAKQNGFDFIAVSSAPAGAAGQQCTAHTPHGYLGIEHNVLDRVRGWLTGAPAAPGG